MTIRQCADMLGVDYFEMNEIMAAENVPIIAEASPGKKPSFQQLKESFS